MSIEVLSRDLNHLFFIHEFKIYDFPKWSDQLNHLAYAGDTIIFASTDKKSLQLIMKVLNHYENQSGHMINEGKSFCYMYSKIVHAIVHEVKNTIIF